MSESTEIYQADAPITPADEKRFAALESQIQEHLFGFRQVGEALLEIRDKRLYRQKYTSFDSYLKQRWDALHSILSRQRAFQLIQAAEIVQDLVDKQVDEVSTNGLHFPLPENERQARALAAVPSEERADVWQEAVEIAGGQAPSARVIEEVINSRKPMAAFFDEEPEEEPAPTKASAGKPDKPAKTDMAVKQKSKALVQFRADQDRHSSKSSMKHVAWIKPERRQELQETLPCVLRYLLDNKIIGFNPQTGYFINENKAKKFLKENSVDVDATDN